ncbi:MAG: cytochrome C, partial [Mariniphaga sp.]
MSIKGSFHWEKNVTPDYIWFNGTADHYLVGDKLDTIPVQMNTLYGSHDDPESKIYPVKIHVGDQIYDKKHNWLIQPKLFSLETGDSAYWKDFDWDMAARAGMQRMGLPYSGEFDFVETEMYWPVNHMVSPKENTVGCAECHTRENGRLEKLTGFYLPGRDRNVLLDKGGFLLFLAAVLGVLSHAVIRIIVSIRKNQYETKIIDYENKEK